jgi:arylsulfatase A-like enzyme
VPGIARYFTRAQLQNGAISPGDAVARRALHGYNAARSGDVVIIPEPYKYLSESAAGTTHGAPYSYDTHVPLILMGPGVKAGRHTRAATPADIAPTLAQLLRVRPPSNAVGRVLEEALGR